MIPSAHDYYRRRAREHRHLANAAKRPEERDMHARLVSVYRTLARDARLHRPILIKS